MNDDQFKLLERQLGTIPVPHFNFAAIETRAARKPAVRISRRGVISAAVLLIVLPALAAAAALYLPVKVEQTRNGDMLLTADTVTADWRATPAFLRRISRALPYRVVWPTSLPSTLRLGPALTAGSGVLALTYRCPGKHLTTFVIMPRMMHVIRASPSLQMRVGVGIRKMKAFYDWNAGEEKVHLETDCLSDAEVARIRSAMTAAGAAKR